jgi:NADH-quinone oxidoreductase subunit D
LNRIASHLLWLGHARAGHWRGDGFALVLPRARRDSEDFRDFIGARLTAHAFRIGGFWWDAYPEFEQRVRDFLKILPGASKSTKRYSDANRIWLQRTVGIGIISAEDAIDLSLTGPCLRGSGVRYDVRKATPYAAYSDFNFEIPIGENGDTYDRYLVRMEEMKQSR